MKISIKNGQFVIAIKTVTDTTIVTDTLNGLDLEKPDLSKGNFAGIDFSNLVLKDANFSDADLRGAKFDNANLERANFRHSKLNGATFENANLKNADFGSAKLLGANLTSANLENANFIWSYLDGINLDDVITDKDTKFSVYFIHGIVSRDTYIDGKIITTQCKEKLD